MKYFYLASSILYTSCFLLLCGCDSLGIPHYLAEDQVPASVKAEPRLVQSPPPTVELQTWPRLGDVPFKPKDFSPKPVYDHYMNELEYHRDEGADAKKTAHSEDEQIASPFTSEMRNGNESFVPPQLPHPTQE